MQGEIQESQQEVDIGQQVAELKTGEGEVPGDVTGGAEGDSRNWARKSENSVSGSISYRLVREGTEANGLGIQ